jgi:hypothetical protein
MMTKSLARTIFGLSFGLVLLISTALAGPQTEAADGAALYKKRCSMCHGAEGKGFSANKTPDFTSTDWQKARTDEKSRDHQGRQKRNPMPAFGAKVRRSQGGRGHLRSLGAKNSLRTVHRSIVIAGARSAPIVELRSVGKSYGDHAASEFPWKFAVSSSLAQAAAARPPSWLVAVQPHG